MAQQRRSKGVFFWLLLGAAVVAGAYAFRGGGSEMSYRSFANGNFPSLNSPGQWLNADMPVSWDRLAGQVVWLEFSFLH